MPGRSSTPSPLPCSAAAHRAAGRQYLLFFIALAAGSGIPSGAEAAWNFFGEIVLAGGKVENPRMLDPDAPASLRRTQMEAATRLTLGTRSTWDKTDFEIAYSPYGEFYEDSDLSQLSHALGLSWDHRYTPRLSLGLAEAFNYNPKLPTDPNGASLGGALVSDSSTLANDFKLALSFRTTQKSSLAWTYRSIERAYSSDQLLDTSGDGLGMEYQRTFGPHVVMSTAYEFGLYSFKDGLPPPVSAAMQDFCTLTPSDPNCIALAALAAQPPAEDQGSGRHRIYAGYAYDVPAGLHVAFDGGYDHLVFSDKDFGSASMPFVRTSLGWNGKRLTGRLGYEQGLDEGGGVLTSAELRRYRVDGHIRFTDNASLELSIAHDERHSVDYDGATTDTALTTLRAGTSFTYKLQRGWALIAAFIHDSQTSSGTSAVPTQGQANRYALGASWSFE